MNSITYRGIEVQIIDQAEEAATIRALYGQPFTNERGEFTAIATVSPYELSEQPAGQFETFSVAVFC